MSDNPLDPKETYVGALATLLSSPKPPQRLPSHLARLLAAPKARPPSAAASDLLGSNPKPPVSGLGLAASDLFGSAPLSIPKFPPPILKAAIKRRACFSFHFDDSWRVNNVRNIWKISHPDSGTMRNFLDSSLWESRRLESPESIKGLITDGVKHTSAVCVLIGTETWGRRWVRYEIARAVIDGRGLLGVHLNSIRHHQTQMTSMLGFNPLDFMAIGKVQANILITPRYFLFERVISGHHWVWNRYGDHSSEVSLPKWLRDPPAGYVTALSEGAPVYDFMRDEGHKNIGAWIDLAAQRAGR